MFLQKNTGKIWPLIGFEPTKQHVINTSQQSKESNKLISKMQKCNAMHDKKRFEEDPLVDLEHHPIQIVASHQGSISNYKVAPLIH